MLFKVAVACYKIQKDNEFDTIKYTNNFMLVLIVILRLHFGNNYKEYNYNEFIRFK